MDPTFTGRYFFADVINNKVWSLGLSIAPGTGEATATNVIDHTADLGAAASVVSSFGVDADGEIYLVSYGAGAVYRLANVITWANPANIVNGTPLSDTQLNATANVPGTFVYAPAIGTVLNVGAGQTLSVTFTPAITTTYATATRTVTINVVQAVGAPTFTDDPLTAGSTAVKGVHITELRQAIEVLRARYGVGASGWTDTSLVAGVTVIKAIHLTELRAGLDAVYAAAGRMPPIYTHTTITGGATVITAVDIAELRTAILAVW
jgi:hypothetical protein